MGLDSKAEVTASEPSSLTETKDEHVNDQVNDGSPKDREPVYPKGVQLTFIAIALALALFLIALDMVRTRPLLSSL